MSEFTLNAPKSNFAPTEPVPQDTHIGILVRMIDLGRQQTEYKGVVKWQPKLQFIFELPFFTKTFNEEKGPQPAWVFARYTFVISDGSNLRPFIENAIGRALTKSEYNTFDVGQLLGKIFEVNVIHKPNPRGGVYENISSVKLITENRKAQLNVDWSKVVAVNPIWGFSVDEAGECFKSERFGDFTDGFRNILLSSEQGIAFTSSGGVPYTKPDLAGSAQPNSFVDNVNPLAKEKPLETMPDDEDTLLDPNHFI